MNSNAQQAKMLMEKKKQMKKYDLDTNDEQSGLFGRFSAISLARRRSVGKSLSQHKISFRVRVCARWKSHRKVLNRTDI